MEEKIYYEQAGAKVTNARFVADEQTFAMSGITSVKFNRQNPSRIGPIILIIAAVLLLRTQHDVELGAYAIFVAPGIIWMLLQRTRYSVLLSTASGESKALAGKDGDFIQGVVNALNQAIIERG